MLMNFDKSACPYYYEDNTLAIAIIGSINFSSFFSIFFLPPIDCPTNIQSLKWPALPLLIINAETVPTLHFIALGSFNAFIAFSVTKHFIYFRWERVEFTIVF